MSLSAASREMQQSQHSSSAPIAVVPPEHDGVHLCEALEALFPQLLPTRSSAKRAARRGRVLIKRSGCSAWPAEASTQRHRRGEQNHTVVRTGDSVRLLSAAEVTARAIAQKNAAFIAGVTSGPCGTTIQARLTTGVDMQVVVSGVCWCVRWHCVECKRS